MLSRNNLLPGVLACALLGACAAEKSMPQWDGKESTAAYAQRAGLAPTLTLDLGDGIKMELVLVPAGKFLMGSPETEKQRNPNEGPQHEVTISKAFYMGKYVVTLEQYQKITGVNPNHFKGPNVPVEQISWFDARDFCVKLSAVCGRTVRLPTEAEFEYACRAGSTTAYYFGDDETKLGDYAWYGSNSNKMMHPVGEKKPNAWGLYDMHGNVWEWCQDLYEEYPAGPVTDPQGATQGTLRDLRGGGWGNNAAHSRSAHRGAHDPDHRGDPRGCRVVVPVSPPPAPLSTTRPSGA
jgi:formylglycine-generating enzyme required for sulfatase activity